MTMGSVWPWDHPDHGIHICDVEGSCPLYPGFFRDK